VSVVVVLRPWEWLNHDQNTVRFFSRTYFWLKGTEDNEPLENVTISFPDPNVENEMLNRFIKDGYWILSTSTDNGIVVEIQALTVVQLVPPRTSELNMEGIGHVYSVAGPKFSFQEVDNLYPGEILESVDWWEIPADMAGWLTLRDSGLSGGYSPTYALVYSTPAKNISGQFFAGLYKLNDDNVVIQKVEEFTDTFENEPPLGWFGLAQA
jgi:hypothetical protein